MIDDKIFRGKCRRLMEEYGDVLTHIIELEEKGMKPTKLGDTAFEVAKETIFQAGILEGMKKIVLKVSQYAKEE